MSDEAKHEPHPILSASDIEQAKKRAQDKLKKEQREAALKAVEEEELNRLRYEEFQTVGGPANEMVSITIDLPPFADKLVTNWNRLYWHGQTYTVPRHIANDLMYRQQCAWQHQAREIDGKKLSEAYRTPRLTTLSALRGVINPPPASLA